MRKKYTKGEITLAELLRSSIYRILHRKAWKHVKDETINNGLSARN